MMQNINRPCFIVKWGLYETCVLKCIYFKYKKEIHINVREKKLVVPLSEFFNKYFLTLFFYLWSTDRIVFSTLDLYLDVWFVKQIITRRITRPRSERTELVWPYFAIWLIPFNTHQDIIRKNSPRKFHGDLQNICD